MTDPRMALIHVMVLTSAADGDMSDAELRTIGDTVRMLPVFSGIDADTLPEMARDVMGVLDHEDGLLRAVDQIREALPPKLRETAYALACDIAAVDGVLTQEELRLLEIIRHTLDLDRLVSAAIERGARARWMTL
ncbi:MAG: tellurite resistance TerB family protein [Rhodospirillaceae bacterium]|nr:tellurite resistance TerB family protein [Rhodospirillaceae bacterium]